MKIEVGESLIASYLNHVEQCRIVQTNWRVSGNWEFGNHDVLWSRQMFDKIKNNELLSNIFKDNTFEQLVKQSEIDVLGINTLENTIYAYDIAFHSMGLNYKGNEGSCEVIVKKIVRAIFSLKIYFPEFEKIESFFVTPKANNKIDNLVKLYLSELDNILNDTNIKIGYLSNDDFFSSLVDSLIDITKNENDTSELFLRAIKLMSLDKRATPITKTNNNSSSAQVVARTGKKRMVNGMKIGQYVKNSMYELFMKKKLDDSELLNLQDLEYCRVKFKIGFPVLIKNTESKKIAEEITGIIKEEVVEGYWLCSQWVENQWDNYLALGSFALTNIEKIFFIYKKSQKILILLLNRAEEILLYKYDYEFPIISNQKFNSYLKEIAEIVGLHKRLTHHVARKTFATTVLLSNGVSMDVVSKLLGHSRIGIMQFYYERIMKTSIISIG